MVDQGVHRSLGGSIAGVTVVSQQLMGGFKGCCARAGDLQGKGVEQLRVCVVLGGHADSLGPSARPAAMLRTGFRAGEPSLRQEASRAFLIWAQR